jgi:RNA polymerase sigma-70 factor (ECF subfamily)
MDQFLDGNSQSFNELYERLAPRVCGFLTSMCRDPRLAEDLTQTTFLKVHRARATFVRGSRVEPWVYAIARRTLLDEKRRQVRRPEDLSADGSIPEPVDLVQNDQPSSRLDPEQERALYDRLNRLPEPQREAITLLKIQGLSMQEAAAVAGTTVGAMKLRAHRAYEALRDALGHKKKSDIAQPSEESATP